VPKKVFWHGDAIYSIAAEATSRFTIWLVHHGGNKHTIPNQGNAYSVFILNFEF
jgi:hypothetical protein